MHRSIDCSTWDDPWFADLGPNAKLIFLYLITNRRVNQCGAMEITIRQISFETGMHAADIPSAIESMGDRIQWWPAHNLLIVRNFYRHQRANTGDKFDIAARKSAELLPDFARVWLYGVYPHLRPEGDTHPIPTPVTPPTHAISVAEAVAGTEAGVAAESGDVITPPTPSAEGKPKRQRSVKTPVPGNMLELVPPEVWREIGDEQRLTDDQLRYETKLMIDHYRGKGERRPDWVSTWKNWMRSEYRKSKPLPPVPPDPYEAWKNGGAAVAPELRRVS